MFQAGAGVGTMALMKVMSLCLLSTAVAVPAPDLSRDKRDADPLLTNFVNDLTRPFRNLFRVSSSQKRPAVTHHHHQHPRPRPPPLHPGAGRGGVPLGSS